jgi:hypothetical protein
MKITDVRARHIRIPYDAGVASFKQGASAIAALDIVIVEVSTDSGLTGWGYACPRSTATAIGEMIAPQARDQDVPDAEGIPAFMERIQRNLHLFGRYGITRFRHVRTRHRAVGPRRARQRRAAATPDRRAQARARFRPSRVSFASAIPRWLRRSARRLSGRGMPRSSCMRRRCLPCSRHAKPSALACR